MALEEVAGSIRVACLDRRENWFVAAPAGVDEEKLSILRESFMEASQDPEYLAEVEEVTGLVPEVSGHAAMDRVIENLSDVDPEIVSTLQDYIETGTQ